MRILHPTDFTRPAGKALAIARDLKHRFGGTLHVVHVQSRYQEGLSGLRLRPQLDSVNPQLDRTLEAERAHETRRLREMLTHLASPDATTELRWGEPIRELLDMQADYDLVVMGAHGSNRLDNFFLGGVAGRFVRRSQVPVITVREESEAQPVERVLVATDFSDASAAAVAMAAKFAAKGVKRVLCHVIDDARFKDDPGYINTVTDSLALIDDGGYERHVIRDGDPAMVLPRVAKEVGADLAIIGLKRQRGAVGLLLGSRVDALIRSSEVPILSVPAPES
ncbi:MAG TPA: universal stress protein [Trueperaceae bacterium]|nr:universal stress protein [Trueperaceae bacterium]